MAKTERFPHPYDNNRENSHKDKEHAKKIAFQFEEWGDGHDKRDPKRKARQGKARRQQWLKHL